MHAVVTQALERIQARGIPVFTPISQISVTGQMSCIGLDNWKVGRTSAWAFAHLCKAPGKIGILMGNPRHRNQEMNETGFRSCFREFAPDFSLLEPVSTCDSAAVAQDLTEVTRAALLCRSMTLVISHRLARDAVDGMVRACANPGSTQTSIVPFEIFTRENI